MRSFCASVSLVCLCACGGGSSGQFGPIDEFGTTLTETAETVSISNEHVDFTLPLAAEYASGSFVAGATADDGIPLHILAFSETDDTFAAILRSMDGGTSADVFVGRTSGIGVLPDGTATLEGTYKGTFNEDDETNLAAFITGDVLLEVDFSQMTLSGDVTNRTTGLFGFTDSSGDLLPFQLSFDLRLQNGTLSKDGTFSGDVITFEDEDGVETILSENGVFEGLLGGENVSEGVGRVFVGSEVGVFAVGH